MISVLLPTYNGEKYIHKSIESVLNQTFRDFELLIGFNGTTDLSKDIAISFGDPRIRLFNYSERGKSKTLNKLLSEAKHDFIALQDDDDIWMPSKLETQFKLINSYDVIGTLISYIDEFENIIGYPTLSTFSDDIVSISLLGENQIANTSTVFNKKSAIEINGWREELDDLYNKGYQPLEDYDFWLRLMRKGKKFTNIPEQLVKHRIHSSSKFNNKILDLGKIL